jgi:3-dehydroquinate synthase
VTRTEEITVDLGDRSYEIVVGRDVIASAGNRIAPLIRRKPVLIITDSTVADLHLASLRQSFDDAGITSEVIVLEPGEHTKEFSVFASLADQILDFGPERSTTLVALGGGVIGDITGFAAAVTLRGIDFIQIPTTLLAQVDSSVGGKTGINTRHGKNLIGCFYQPRLVLADTGVLNSLPLRELQAGYAEIVKYGLLGDAAFFQWLETRGDALLAGDEDLRRQAIVTSCQAKARIVSEDEREADKRALLNLGHTFGHAFEAETGFGPRLLHGEAVAIGMVMAFDLSCSLGLCPADDAVRVRNHLSDAGLPTGLHDLADKSWSADILIDHMRKDKKVHDGRISFVLTRGIGNAFITDDVALDDLRTLLQNALAA